MNSTQKAKLAIYSMLKDEAEETIWRCMAYNNTYQQLFRKNFRQLYSEDALFRFVFGVPSSSSPVHARPLSKLTRDVVEDMIPYVDPLPG